MELITVRGHPTLESIGQDIEITDPRSMELLSMMPELPDEVEYYAHIESDLDYIYKTRDEDTSRRVMFNSDTCISYIQLLLWRNPPVMIVTMRSSSAARIWSDLGFLARTAMRYGCLKLIVHFGSFHLELQP